MRSFSSKNSLVMKKGRVVPKGKKSSCNSVLANYSKVSVGHKKNMFAINNDPKQFMTFEAPASK